MVPKMSTQFLSTELAANLVTAAEKNTKQTLTNQSSFFFKISKKNFEDMKRLDYYMQDWKLIYYWNKWKKYTIQVKYDSPKLARLRKIELFIHRLAEKASDSATYTQNMEKKVKNLKTRQGINHGERLYHKRKFKNEKENARLNETEKNFQLNKIEEELTLSTLEACELMHKHFKNFNVNSQPKIKCLSSLPYIKNRLYNIQNEEIKSYPTPKFLTRMENRYKERKKRWEYIQEKKRQIQAEKERIAKEMEIEKAKIEEMRKREKLAELYELKRQKEKAKEELEQRKIIFKQKNKQAENHYKMYLIRTIGWKPWSLLVQKRRMQLTDSVNYYVRFLRNFYFKRWLCYTRTVTDLRSTKVDMFYKKVLLRMGFYLLKTNYNEFKRKVQVAVDWEEAKLEEKIFEIWLRYVRTENLYCLEQEQMADTFYDRQLLVKYLRIWTKFPQKRRYEEEREKRKRLWQRKVQEFLPDYQPANISEV